MLKKKLLSGLLIIGVVSLLLNIRLSSTISEDMSSEMVVTPVIASGDSETQEAAEPSAFYHGAEGASVIAGGDSEKRKAVESVAFYHEGEGESSKVPVLKSLALMLQKEGVDAVIDYLRKGEGKVDIEAFSEVEAYKMSMLLSKFSSPEQLKQVLSEGILRLDKNATTYAMSTMIKDENGLIDQQIIIQKLDILAEHGFDLTNAQSMTYGLDNNFNKAVRLGLNEVVHYLAYQGIQPTSMEDLWKQCASSILCDSNTVSELERLSYTPPESFSKD